MGVSKMQTAFQYLTRTESAVRLLFDGIDSYLKCLRKVVRNTFDTSEPLGPNYDAEFAAWCIANSQNLAAARAVDREFIAESFALSTLCGGVLQVAGKALEIYSKNTNVPPEWIDATTRTKAKFCVGRPVRTVPLGLIIYAGRNQHTHFNENQLHEPSAAVFNRLSTQHGFQTSVPFIDPAFDINNTGVTSYASNIMNLIEWRSYDQYAKDMSALLV